MTPTLVSPIARSRALIVYGNHRFASREQESVWSAVAVPGTRRWCF